MGADVEIGEWRAPLAACAAVGEKAFPVKERGYPRKRQTVKPHTRAPLAALQRRVRAPPDSLPKSTDSGNERGPVEPLSVVKNGDLLLETSLKTFCGGASGERSAVTERRYVSYSRTLPHIGRPPVFGCAFAAERQPPRPKIVCGAVALSPGRMAFRRP